MKDERLLTPTNVPEDAAAYLLDADRALLFTADYFTPVVDDPFMYGQIAAANAFSDIYAMGGKPVLALNLTNFPSRLNRLDEMEEILRGGAKKAMEAGCLVAGGHTIDDAEPKYGMAVVGFADPGRMIHKNGARPGDFLYLTKPLGTGILTTAFKNDAISEKELAPAAAVMAKLNKEASESAVEARVTAGTDVTGFGLLGHLWEMCEQAGVSATLYFSALPFIDGVEALAREEWIPGGTYANRDLVAGHVELAEGLPDHRLLMAADAQTSGGLLLAIPREKQPAFAVAMRSRGQEYWIVGEVHAGPVKIKIVE